MIALLLPWSLACSSGAKPVLDSAADTASAASSCGDSVLDVGEACDDGASNDDAAPDACRTDCLAARCGDGVVDAVEACDDGGALGGDGCDPDCAVETGLREAEPNDSPAQATPGVGAGGLVHGSLPSGDVDCWTVEVPSCGAVRAEQADACASPLELSATNPAGVRVAIGAPGAGEDGACSVLDPSEQPGARWAEAGAWIVCVSGVRGAPVAGYTLALAGATSEGLPTVGTDLDGDSTPDTCDTDDDGDGIPDLSDDCPSVSNGPDTMPGSVSASGFVRTWLAAGPFTGGASDRGCRPSEDPFVGEGPDWTAPHLGDAVGANRWIARTLASDGWDMLDPWGSVPAPREGYGHASVWSDTARILTLAVGVDDGAFAWWNGALVLDIDGCQGVNVDQFKASVDVQVGWNDLLVKVRDQGGGWGLAVRFLDASGAVVTDLRTVMSAADGLPAQSDRDGDGVGDACDPTP